MYIVQVKVVSITLCMCKDVISIKLKGTNNFFFWGGVIKVLVDRKNYRKQERKIDRKNERQIDRKKEKNF